MILTNYNQLLLIEHIYYICSDGLHLTPSGNRVVFEEVIMKLKDEGISVDTMPVDLPLITEIDPNDPLKVFQQ